MLSKPAGKSKVKTKLRAVLFWDDLYKTINEIQGQKNKNATDSDGVFDYAPEDQEISNRFRGDLLIFNELIHLYQLQNCKV